MHALRARRVVPHSFLKPSDPRRETADADLANNHFPPKIEEGQATITEQPDRQNEMQRARKAAEPKPDEPPNPNPGG